MKRLLCCLSLLAVAFTATAQTDRQKLDMPPNSPMRPPFSGPQMPMHRPKAPLSPPAFAVGTIGGRSIWIAYSSPRVRGRAGHIFTKDGLISKNPHYPVWRAGANSATTLIVSGKMKIGSVEVPAGAYTLFVDISDPDHWTLIVSKATGEWGLSYDATQDLGRTPMEMSTPAAMMDDLRWKIVDKGAGMGEISLGWEHHVASVPVDAR